MNDNPRDPRKGIAIDTSNIILGISAYTANLKITGQLHLNVSARSSDRRPSDLIHNFPGQRMTLSKVKIYSIQNSKLLEETPFIVLNIETVDILWAEEIAVD